MTEITLLDGSIGQELVRLSGEQATPLWSTSVMIDRPDLVRQVHDSYFAAGATIATTNTYAVLRDRLERVGMEGDLEALTETALHAAISARDENGGGLVAGSLGPLFGSYRPDICPPPDEGEQLYGETVALLAGRCDLLLIETVSSVDHAEGALRAAGKAEIPVWLAVTVDDFDGQKLRSGEPLATLAATVARYQPDAVLINCSRPEAVKAALSDIAGFGKPFGAYANGFTDIDDGFLADFPTVDALQQRTDLGPAVYADFAMSWIEQGATIVGGCCEVGPQHIAELAARLRAAGHRIV